MAAYTVRPLSDRLWLRPSGDREMSRFTATWTQTEKLLIAEVFAIQFKGMPDPVIEVDVPERAIRIDGGLYANAKAETPAVVVAFESRHGPLIYRCDRYVPGWGSKMEAWQHNVRAIALTLEALRAVDRYGATRTGEQYRGFRALPAGTGLASTSMTTDDALKVIARHAEVHESVLKERKDLREFTRRAKGATHPDRHDGAQFLWNHVTDAIEVLRRQGSFT